MDWKARLDGHGFDLDTLVEIFREGDPVLGRDDDGYYLSSSAFDGLEEPVAVKDRAEILLRKVNGLGRLLDSSFEPVKLSGSFTTKDGHTTHVLSPDSARVRTRASAATVTVGGQPPPPPPPPPGPKYVRLADGERDVADALKFLGSQDEPDWFLLWKAFEIIQHAVGSRKAIETAGWATTADLNAFCASANLETVSGDDARHARKAKASDRPPVSTMDLREARRFVYGLAKAWLDSKLGGSAA